jgi:hypothetical protein
MSLGVSLTVTEKAMAKDIQVVPVLIAYKNCTRPKKTQTASHPREEAYFKF